MKWLAVLLAVVLASLPAMVSADHDPCEYHTFGSGKKTIADPPAYPCLPLTVTSVSVLQPGTSESITWEVIGTDDFDDNGYIDVVRDAFDDDIEMYSYGVSLAHYNVITSDDVSISVLGNEAQLIDIISLNDGSTAFGYGINYVLRVGGQVYDLGSVVFWSRDEFRHVMPWLPPEEGGYWTIPSQDYATYFAVEMPQHAEWLYEIITVMHTEQYGWWESRWFDLGLPPNALEALLMTQEGMESFAQMMVEQIDVPTRQAMYDALAAGDELPLAIVFGADDDELPPLSSTLDVPDWKCIGFALLELMMQADQYNNTDPDTIVPQHDFGPPPEAMTLFYGTEEAMLRFGQGAVMPPSVPVFLSWEDVEEIADYTVQTFRFYFFGN